MKPTIAVSTDASAPLKPCRWKALHLGTAMFGDPPVATKPPFFTAGRPVRPLNTACAKALALSGHSSCACHATSVDTVILARPGLAASTVPVSSGGVPDAVIDDVNTTPVGSAEPVRRAAAFTAESVPLLVPISQTGLLGQRARTTPMTAPIWSAWACVRRWLFSPSGPGNAGAASSMATLYRA